jgi:hypothetical protein
VFIVANLIGRAESVASVWQEGYVYSVHHEPRIQEEETPEVARDYFSSSSSSSSSSSTSSLPCCCLFSYLQSDSAFCANSE